MFKLCGTVMVVALLCSGTFGQSWNIIQITNNDLDDRSPAVSGTNVAWHQDDGNDKEIFLYDGSAITQLTDNNVDDFTPDVSGSHVAWHREVQGNVDMVYDGKILMSGAAESSIDMIFESGVLAWSAKDPVSLVNHLYLYDGVTTKRLSLDGTSYNYNPDMSGDKVVWSGFNDDGATAYLYDGVTTVELPENVGRGQMPKISGDNIVGIGMGPDGVNDQAFLYDGVTNTPLGHTDGWDMHVRIAGENIAWLSEVDGVHEVFVYEEGQAKQLSFNSVGAKAPAVSESFIAWSADKGNGYEVFVYDGINTIQLTNNNYKDSVFDISGNTIVWEQYDGTDYEIFMATYDVPEPSTLMLVLTITSWVTFIRIRR